MALPVLTLHLAQTKLAAYCAQKIPAEIRDRVRLEFEVAGDMLTLIESRPHFRTPEIWTRLPVARFRYNPGSETWSLDCPHLGNPELWRPYPAKPQHDLGQLIKLLDEDDSGAFWG
ncbi:MAG: DUF3024 domain-containing protein [Azonexus sp.]